jgi:hypothetical protein
LLAPLKTFAFVCLLLLSRKIVLPPRSSKQRKAKI